MLKKILGGLLWVAAALALIGAISNGSLMDDRGSAAATYGAFIGFILPIITYIFSGIFLMTFDGVYKKNYIEGFKARGTQCVWIIVFLVIYGIFAVMVSFGGSVSGVDNVILAYIIIAWPYLIPMLLFCFMLAYYVIPYWNCNMKFAFTEGMLHEYFSAGGAVKAYTEDNSVVANSKILFFPKTFCIFPLSQIASVKFVNIIVEQDVYINLTNGKKIEMVASQKLYNGIIAAINDNK